MKKPIFLIALSISLLMLYTGCQKRSLDLSQGVVKPNELKDNEISINSFSKIPSEIDGCSCYFSNDSNEFKLGKFIYVNDFGDISFLSINGEMIRFKQTEYKAMDSLTTVVTANSSEYELKIRIIKGRETGEESQLQTGTLTIKDKKGKKAVKKFYGECGC
jgi:hypothetical protein